MPEQTLAERMGQQAVKLQVALDTQRSARRKKTLASGGLAEYAQLAAAVEREAQAFLDLFESETS